MFRDRHASTIKFQVDIAHCGNRMCGDRRLYLCPMPARVEIEVTGEGPPVLFLHGTPTRWDVLRPIAGALPHNQALLAALPGYGAAAPWPGRMTEDDVVDAIERAVLALGLRRIRIVGFSGGAHHALRIASRRFIEVDVLVALGGLGDPSAEERAGFRGLVADLRAGKGMAGLATALFLSPAFAHTHPDACARVEAWMTSTQPENLARELDAVADAAPVLPTLAAFEGRIVARTGSLDRATSPAHAEAIARACPRGVVQIVPGCGHALLEEDREETLRAVIAAVAA